MRNIVARRFVFQLAYYAVAIALSIYPRTHLYAQTTFLWPDSKFDLTNYKHIETCQTVRKRVTDSTMVESDVNTDTLPIAQFNSLMQVPAIVTQSTKQCLSKFPPNSVALNIAYLAQSLYLSAGEDANAEAVLTRKLKSIPTDSATQLFAVLDSGIEEYTLARPSRMSAAFDLYSQFEQMGLAVPAQNWAYPINKLLRGSQKANDAKASERGLSLLVKLAKSVTTEQWDGQDGILLSAAVYTWLSQVRPADFEAALAHSTERYQTLTEKMFQDLVGRPLRESFFTKPAEIVGKPTARIEGDFWFPASNDGGGIYPRPGVVTLVVGVNPEKDWANANVMAAVLRRIKQKHPELEIILMGKTVGWFKVEAPPEPHEEAAFLDAMFRKFYNIPAILTVTNTKFWRVPGLDRRRINELTTNEENGYDMDLGKLVLIDKEGRAVAGTGQIELWPEREDQLEGLIGVLIKRQPQSK